MAKNVVIVESPAKVQSVHKYLGNDYEVLASYGHIRDLPSKNGSVDPENNFAMIWEMDDRGQRSMAAIEKAVKSADTLYLATDPDREGEAISWHVAQVLSNRNVLKGKNVQRIVFNEITKTAVQNAVKHPRAIDQQLVDAYLARRALDYLVGFNLSPVLWRKLPGSRSAGRVQSVALRLIVEREQEIEAFTAREYWSITGDFLNIKNQKFSSRLSHVNGKKLDKFDLNNETSAQAALKVAEGKDYGVESVEKKQTRRNPAAPFITSTLQQEASRKLGFGASRTMQVAQKLYEGINLGGETTGLITYMRTDGVTLSNDALNNIRGYVGKHYGDKYLPNAPRVFKSKSKNAQEAHEAIRPTDIARTPQSVAKYLDEAQLKLYDLIWKRAIACQMEAAIFDQVAVDVAATDGSATFHATGSTLFFDGFLKVYQEGVDDDAESDEDKLLPELNKGEKATLNDLIPNQHFTQAPPRFSEATLVKKLEELSIGRPSTYASIIQVLQDRDYVRIEKKQFHPEDRGRIVTSFLTHFFKRYVEYDFTANLEEELDDISDGKLDWLKVIGQFWTDFNHQIDETQKIRVTEVIDTLMADLDFFLFKGKEENRKCPDCADGTINLKLSRFGAFLGCSNYPECKYTKKLTADGGGEEGAYEQPQVVELGMDPELKQMISLRKGPYGYYLQWENPNAGPKEKPKRVAIPGGVAPSSVTIEQAVSLRDLPKQIGVHPEYGAITVGIGRFGPYVKYESTFVSIPKTDDVLNISVERCGELILKKLESPSKGRAKKVTPAKAPAKKAAVKKPAAEKVAKPKAPAKTTAVKKAPAKKAAPKTKNKE